MQERAMTSNATNFGRIDAILANLGFHERTNVMNHKPLVLGLTFALATIATEATGWSSWGTRDGDARMTMSANPGGFEGDNAAYDCFVLGAVAWNRASCSDFLFIKGDPALVNRSVPRTDSHNHIKFGDAGGALAVTYLLRDSANRECDVIFGDNINWDIAGWVHPAKYDLQGVAAHEFGHVLGLGHSETSEATMYYAISAGNDKWRTLHSDDEDGVCSLY